MDETNQFLIEHKLDVPFKEFTAGQVIQSKQFNDDMRDIEDKTNEIISKFNTVVGNYTTHQKDYNNPHQVTAHQVGSYTISEVDDYLSDIRGGNLNDKSISNRVLADGVIDTRTIQDNSVTLVKLERDFGTQLDISKNIDIVGRYTKQETDALIQSKVGDGTYSKEEIENMLNQIQAGQIADKSVGVEQLKSNVGRLINLSSNPSVIDRYTKIEVDNLIANNGIPRDFGSIMDKVDGTQMTSIGSLPIANVMTCNEFIASNTNLLDIDVKEVIDARATYVTLAERLNSIESVLDKIILMFSEVVTNE